MKKKKRLVKATILTLAVLLVSTIFLGTGYYLGFKKGQENGQYSIINKTLNQPEEIDFSVFWEIWDEIHQRYAHPQDLDDQKLVRGAVRGMVEAIGDPFSAFMPPSETKRFTEDLDGSFGGVGIRIEMKNHQLTISSPLKDTPGERAGLQAGDIILKIDGQNTEEMGFEEMVSKIRGEVGAEVVLTVYREGWTNSREFDIAREKIVVKSVDYELINNDKTGLISINQFGNDTWELLQLAVEEINKNKPENLVLDLRNNPGGYLSTAVQTASLFIEDGIIVKQVGKKEKEYKAKGPAKLGNYPLVVLVNGGSASASEIVAGALKDYHKATLIGETTFGKGSIQDLEEIPSWGSLRLTVGLWQTPNGDEINDKGIKPGIEIEMKSKLIGTNKDSQLKRALKELK